MWNICETSLERGKDGTKNLNFLCASYPMCVWVEVYVLFVCRKGTCIFTEVVTYPWLTLCYQSSWKTMTRHDSGTFRDGEIFQNNRVQNWRAWHHQGAERPAAWVPGLVLPVQRVKINKTGLEISAFAVQTIVQDGATSKFACSNVQKRSDSLSRGSAVFGK